MTEQEITLINSYRTRTLNKGHLNELLNIYTKYSGLRYNGCFCGGSARKEFKQIFYTWYDNNYPTEQQ